MIGEYKKGEIHQALVNLRTNDEPQYVGLIGCLTKRQKRDADAELKRHRVDAFTTADVYLNRDGLTHLDGRTEKDDYTIKQIVHAVEKGMDERSKVIPDGANKSDRIMLRLEVGSFVVLLSRDRLGRPSLFNAYSKTSGKKRNR